VTQECSCIKVNVSMPDELVRTVRDVVGPAMFDKYISATVAQRLRLDLLDDLSAEFEAEFGPIPSEVRQWTAERWPRLDGRSRDCFKFDS
jgi:hypothetical protein